MRMAPVSILFAPPFHRPLFTGLAFSESQASSLLRFPFLRRDATRRRWCATMKLPLVLKPSSRLIASSLGCVGDHHRPRQTKPSQPRLHVQDVAPTSSLDIC